MTGTAEDDKALLSRFSRHGDEGAFKELVQRHQQPLYQFIWRRVGHEHDAIDLCQKVFIQVFTRAEQFRGEASFKTWLYQIAINLCKNHFRDRDRQRLDSVAIEDLELHAREETMDCIAELEEQNLLYNAVTHLPDKQRTTLELHLYQGHTFAEVAAIMHCPVGTAKANYHHAIVSLRKILGEAGNEPC